MAALAVALQLVNVNSQGVQGDGHSIWADISRDGHLVAFDSFAGNLTSRPLQRPDDQEVYLTEGHACRTPGQPSSRIPTCSCVTCGAESRGGPAATGAAGWPTPTAGACDGCAPSRNRPAGAGPGSEGAAISPDGRYGVFYTGGRLAASDTDALGDAYLCDRRRGSVAVVSPGPLDCFHAGILELTPFARHVLHWCGDMVRVAPRPA